MTMGQMIFDKNCRLLLHCKKCGYEWHPLDPNKLPKTCQRCRGDWREERVIRTQPGHLLSRHAIHGTLKYMRCQATKKKGKLFPYRLCQRRYRLAQYFAENRKRLTEGLGIPHWNRWDIDPEALFHVQETMVSSPSEYALSPTEVDHP
jgi:hypothetical protein